MDNPVPTRNLAYEIGLCHIALVVGQVQRKMRRHGTLAHLFSPVNDADRRARLTHFWWVVLGGSPLHYAGLQQAPIEFGEQINGEVLRDWMAVFRHAALPIIGADFTSAWIEATERLVRQRLVTKPNAPSQEKVGCLTFVSV